MRRSLRADIAIIKSFVTWMMAVTAQTPETQINKSLLLLFFRKEALACL
jgi:hypothetical protein